MIGNFTATEARQNFFYVLEKAEKPGMAVTITREGHPAVIMMSVEDYEGWMETLEIMADRELLNNIQKGMNEKGTVTLADLERSRHAAPRAVQSRSQTKRRKAVRKTA